MPVGEVIRRKRKEQGITQEQVAQRLGVSAPAVNKWERGFGRYDVILELHDPKEKAFIMEFKVRDPEDEKDLSATVQSALRQIDDKKYDTVLSSKGFPAERIRKYGFAFQGKKVLIGCE